MGLSELGRLQGRFATGEHGFLNYVRTMRVVQSPAIKRKIEIYYGRHGKRS